MLFHPTAVYITQRLVLLIALTAALSLEAQVVTQTNSTVRVVAANISSGNNQRYEGPGLRILKGLKPDIVAIQEFNYASTNGLGINTPAAFREMVDATFGTNFVYYRESSGSETYSIPNGVISRYPFLASGTWDDVLIPDRGYAWARIDIPGTNDLYVVSVHLKASSGSASTRASEATNLKTLIQTFPSNSFVIVAGDMNIDSNSEAALATFKTFLSDDAVPTDGVSLSPTNTNEPRSERYDYVLPSFSMTNLLTPVVFPSRTFNSGLVFDSGVYTPLSDVSPVQAGDSHVPQMQHMAIVKDFKFTYAMTNFVSNAPFITVHPQSQSVIAGSNAVFSVTATGAPPLLYQWRFGNANIAGASSSMYTRTNVQMPDIGLYSVIVSNSAAAVTSSNAALSVIFPPAIVGQPEDRLVAQGSNAFFFVSHTGSFPFYFQWRHNVTNILNVNDHILTVTNVQPEDVGTYSLMISNPGGVVVSSNAMLRLIVPQPVLKPFSANLIEWQGLSNLPYRVEIKTNLDDPNWIPAGTVSSATGRVFFTNDAGATQRFFRVVYP